MSNTPPLQPGILERTPPVALFLSFTLMEPQQAPAALLALQPLADGQQLVLGLGQSLAVALGTRLENLRDFPQMTAPGIDGPATPQALWCWLRGEDRGDLMRLAQQVNRLLRPAFALQTCVDAFRHGGEVNRDLARYEDGTENPEGEEAVRLGFDAQGGSFVAVQLWEHDFERMEALHEAGEMDDVFGRRLSDNSEIEEAPESAHVKRTEQESFEPEAHILRRNMPWSQGLRGGTVFIGFGCTLDAFEVQWRRMMGADDGITDALFRFTRPLSGAYYWCPPLREGRVDLGALGL